MSSEFEFLVEKEVMWAKMLLEVLKDNDIPCAALPVYGTGLVVKTMRQERLRIFVPSEKKLLADELLNELFSGSENQ